MTATKSALRLDRQQARAAVFAAQGLLAPSEDPVAVLEGSGFVRTLGGIDVYIALKARVPGLRRQDVDDAAAAQRLQVLPAARGCIYLLARRDAPLALRVAELLSRPREAREHEKVGIADAEVEELAAATLELLRARGALATAAIRQALPSGAVRSLGEAGKKLGISSPLPAALRRLEFAGDIERTLEGGRLDSEKYLWRATAQNLFAQVSLPAERTELFARFGEVFFGAAGLASRKAFAEWAGIAQKEAAAAVEKMVEKMALLPVEVAGEKDLFYALESCRELLETSPEAAASALAFLPFEDNTMALQGGLAFFTESRHHDFEVQSWGMGRKNVRLGEAKHAQLRSLLAEGRLAGFWEFDPERRDIAVGLLPGADKETRRRAEEKAQELGSFIEKELGHGRSFNLDTDEDMKRRATYLRSLS